MAKPWLSKTKLVAIAKRHAKGKSTSAQFNAEISALVRDAEAALKRRDKAERTRYDALAAQCTPIKRKRQ